jgi:hypothetical protein
MGTIFIAMPALDDSELVPTVHDAFAKAKHPEKVFIGVALLYSTRRYVKDFKSSIKKYGDQVRYNETKVTARNVLETLGVGRGRKLAANLYSGEDYVLQVDSHTLFPQDWDEKLTELHKEASQSLGLEKVILTGYSGHYHYSEEDTRVPYTDDGRLRYPFIHSEQRFSALIPNWWDVPVPEDYPEKFIPCIKFNANFSFGDKFFGEYNGVLEDAVFFEEELTQTINLTAAGFNLVFPVSGEPLICHLYSSHANDFGGHRSSIQSYMSGMVLEVFNRRTEENYMAFVRDPKNREAIKKWEKYAKCSLTFGPLKSNHIPEYYINQPDSDLKSSLK